MKKVMMYSAGHPWLVLSVLGLVTLAALPYLDNLKVNISAESMMIQDSSAWEFFQQTEQAFGSDSTTIVFLRDPKLFKSDKLRAIREAVLAIEALPFVRASSSLYSMRNVQNVDGFIHTGPYLGEIPSELQSIEVIKQEALRNPLVRGNLLSDDATAMAINISLKRQASRPGFDKEVTLSIEQAIAPLRSQIEDVFQIGGSSIRNALTARILHDQLLVLPLSLMVLVITLVITLRSVNGALLPLLTAGLSVVWTLGLMALLDIPLNVMTSIIPALLIIIGSTEDIHLLAEYQSGIGQGMVRVEAIEHMATTMGTAVLLTFVTTYLGFLSISLNNIELLYQFGVMASSGLLLNFLITVFLHPIYLRYFGQCPANSSLGTNTNVYTQMAVLLHQTVSTNKRLTFGLIVTLVLVSGYGTLSLKVNNNPMDYFGKESIIQQHADTLHRHLSGVHTFSIIIDSGIDETFLQVKYLAEIQKLQTYLSHTGMFDRSFSFADFVSLVHGIMNDGEQDTALLPESDDIVREYMLFIKHRDVRDYVSAQYNRARIIVRHNMGSSYDLNQAVVQIRDYANEHLDVGLRVEITGETVLANQAADSMAHAQAQSLFLMVLSIFLIVSLLFVNIRAGLIAVTPILIPIVALFGVMGFAGIPLDSGTSMVAAIAMGVCVDDTMHFMSRYHHRLQARKDGAKALRDTVRAEAIPIISTSLALAAGFATLALSSFLPVAYFGLLSAMVICLALMATFLLTPLLLGTTQLITAWDLLSVKLRRECITRCALFRGMAIWQIKKILLVINVQEYQTGQLIIAQGELGRDVFVILEGEVEIRKRRTDGAAVRLKTLGIGEIFGEIALLSERPRTAEVKAIETTRVLGLSWDKMNRLGRIFPHISVKLFRNLSAIVGDRLAHADDEYITLKDSLTGVYTSTFMIEQIKAEVARFNRFREPLSAIVMTVAYNPDVRGHVYFAGYEVLLRRIAYRISRRVRLGDIVARWTSCTFIVLLPRTGLFRAQGVAKRLDSMIGLDESLQEIAQRVCVKATCWSETDNLESFLARASHLPSS